MLRKTAQSQTKNRIQLILAIGGFGLLGYVLLVCGQILVGFLKTPEGQFAKVALGVLLSAILVTAPLGFALACLYARRENRRTALFVSIVVLGGLLRLVWVLAFPTPPTSDFLVNQQIALSLSRSDFQPLYDRSIGYPVFLAMAYGVYPNSLAGRLLNVLLGTLSIGLVYRIGQELRWPVAGFAAAYVLAVLPNEIMMSSLLCTEVGGTTFLCAATLSLLWVRGARKPLGATILAGVMLGLAVLFRPNSIILMPLALVLLWKVGWEDPWERCSGLVLYALGVLMPMLLVAGWHSLASGNWSFAPLHNRSAAYMLMSGTNIASKGIYDYEEAILYWSWPADQRLPRALQIAASRIMENPVGFLSLVGVKLQRLVSEGAYGEYWAMAGISGSPLGVPLYRWTYGLLVWAQSLHMVVLLLAGIFLGIHSPHRIGLRLSLIIALMLVISPHIFLESQARYQHILIPFLVIAAGCGMALTGERLHALPSKRGGTVAT